MSALPRSRNAVVGLVAAVMLMAQAMPASAATALDDFAAPFLGASASVTATVMPRVVDVTCAGAQCAAGVLPSPVLVESTRYFSTSVAPGGTFGAVPGFRAKLIRSWAHTGDVGRATFTLMLVAFRSGTSLETVVADDARARGLTLTGPAEVNGLTTWTASGSEAPGMVTRFSYSANGSELAFGRCLMSESLQASGACSEQNVAAVASAASARAVPTSARLSRKVQALIPSMPKGLNGVVASQQLSSNLFDVAHPAMTTAPVMARQLAGTMSADLQYGVISDPSLYVFVKIAPVDTVASRAALGQPCDVSSTWDCTSTKLRGTGRGFVERHAPASSPQDVLQVTGRWNGSGRWLKAACSLTDYTPLTEVQADACSAAIASVVAASRQG